MRSSILTLSGAFLAAIMTVSVWAWQYQDLPMVKCTWCGTVKDLQRHHYRPQHAFPALRDDPSNLVVLCRRDHLSIAHRGNFKLFNPDLAEILTKYTNTCANVPEGDDDL